MELSNTFSYNSNNRSKTTLFMAQSLIILSLSVVQYVMTLSEKVIL